MQDVELMNVITLSDIGSGTEEDKRNSKQTISSTTEANAWGSTTVGQCVIIMEFVWIIRELRLQQSSDVCDFTLSLIFALFNF
jgi:hypothetical protein